jgi:hypothetical protein
MTNTLACHNIKLITVKIFMKHFPVPNVVKLFKSVTYECSQLARMFAPHKFFQTSLTFASKAGAYLSVAHFRIRSRGGFFSCVCPFL